MTDTLPSDEAIAEALRLSATDPDEGWTVADVKEAYPKPDDTRLRRTTVALRAIIAFARYIEGHPRND